MNKFKLLIIMIAVLLPLVGYHITPEGNYARLAANLLCSIIAAASLLVFVSKK